MGDDAARRWFLTAQERGNPDTDLDRGTDTRAPYANMSDAHPWQDQRFAEYRNTGAGAGIPVPANRPQLTAGAGPGSAPVAASVPAQADHHDVLLRRLRELGELHRDGVLTDEEFAATKAAVLRGF